VWTTKGLMSPPPPEQRALVGRLLAERTLDDLSLADLLGGGVHAQHGRPIVAKSDEDSRNDRKTETFLHR